MDDQLRRGERGLGQVDLDAAQDRHRGDLVPDAPAALALGAAEDADQVRVLAAAVARVAAGGRRRGLHAPLRQVAHQRLQLAQRLGRVDTVEPLGVLARVEPALGQRLAQDVGDPVPVGVRRTQVGVGSRRGQGGRCGRSGGGGCRGDCRLRRALRGLYGLLRGLLELRFIHRPTVHRRDRSRLPRERPELSPIRPLGVASARVAGSQGCRGGERYLTARAPPARSYAGRASATTQPSEECPLCPSSNTRICSLSARTPPSTASSPRKG
ncbi:hypothetical protein SCOCK_240066 [Actinacidiphila cocklensis]|uniref:Uncharacterized protein n=1 Tax=Actinacidiphila cocklensis TaxID=887465 RepID=A0A9W4GQY6_9ACTN|nr:hypothetical protein SCOCK_240066 [Actinacidiphila cocklensis]